MGHLLAQRSPLLTQAGSVWKRLSPAAQSCELTTQDGSPERFWAEWVD